jgi:3-methyladenine DNA glycosylase AlkD
MELKQLHQEVSDFCREHGDPVVIQKYSRYFREGYDAYGVPDEVLRPFRERFIAEHAKQLTPKNSLALGRLLMSSGKYEEAMTAIVLARHVLPQLTAASIAEFEYWLEHCVTNWAVCDVLSGELISSLLVSGVTRPSDLAGWRRAPSRWRRRALPVSAITLLKHDADISELLKFIEPMLHDDERVVQQGLGWLLRECWKKEPLPVEALLLKHKDTAPRLVYQYACEKMDKAAKERFKRAKPSKG